MYIIDSYSPSRRSNIRKFDFNLFNDYISHIDSQWQQLDLSLLPSALRESYQGEMELSLAKRDRELEAELNELETAQASKEISACLNDLLDQ